jgi:hypothetical protein
VAKGQSGGHTAFLPNSGKYAAFITDPPALEGGGGGGGQFDGLTFQVST